MHTPAPSPLPDRPTDDELLVETIKPIMESMHRVLEGTRAMGARLRELDDAERGAACRSERWARFQTDLPLYAAEVESMQQDAALFLDALQSVLQRTDAMQAQVGEIVAEARRPPSTTDHGPQN